MSKNQPKSLTEQIVHEASRKDPLALSESFNRLMASKLAIVIDRERQRVVKGMFA